MQLSADQLASFSAALKVSDHQPKPSERRRTQRLDVRATVAVTLINEGQRGESLMPRLRDLSPRGIALLHTAPLQQGQQFVVTLPRDDGPSVMILCTVMHSRPGQGTLHTIGAEFTCALNNQPASNGPTTAELYRIRSSVLG